MKIIVAIDGSPSSEAAVSAVVNLRWEKGTEIKLVMVIDSFDDLQYQAMHKVAQSALDGIAQQLRKNLNECTVTYEIGQGEAKSQILSIAALWPANLIVMGCRSKKGVGAMLLGSVSQAVLMESGCPVLIAKSEASKSSAAAFKNILLTVDNSPYSRAALGWLESITWAEGALFRLLTIVQPLAESFDSVGSLSTSSSLTRQYDQTAICAKAELGKLATQLSTVVGEGKVSTEIRDGDPKEIILNVAAAWSADLIVLGSHGRTGFDRLLLGSVSQAVALHAPCSVAIVRGLERKGQGRKEQTGRFKAVDTKDL